MDHQCRHGVLKHREAGSGPPPAHDVGNALQELGRAFFTAIHAAVMSGAHRLPAFPAGAIIGLVSDGLLEALEELVLAGARPGQQHFLERLDDQAVPIEAGQELPELGLQFHEIGAGYLPLDFVHEFPPLEAVWKIITKFLPPFSETV
jgi:hypothetical protein